MTDPVLIAVRDQQVLPISPLGVSARSCRVARAVRWMPGSARAGYSCIPARRHLDPTRHPRQPPRPRQRQPCAYAGDDPINNIDAAGQLTKAQLCSFGGPTLLSIGFGVSTIGGGIALGATLGVVTAPVGGFAAILTFTADLYLGAAGVALAWYRA